MLNQLPKINGLIFSSQHGTVPNLSILRRNLRHLCTKANVPYVGIHGLRHVHASLVVASGIDVKTLQVRLGHSRPSTTMNIYPYLMPGRAELAARALDTLLRGQDDGQ
jgi:integrase